MTNDKFLLKAPAKINWFLRILGLRNDGYHEIRSLIQKITLYDELTFLASDDIAVKTNLDIPIKENLVYKTIVMLRKEYRVKKGVTIRLKKNIPVGAGLGGGSSDAAATLTGLRDFWSLKISDNDLFSIAEQIGSDVPFFLDGPLAFVEGRGERIRKTKARLSLNLLLVKPSFNISTAWAYRKFSDVRSRLTKQKDNVDNIEQFIGCVARADIACISRYNNTILNDLEAVSLKTFPLIAEIKKRLHEKGALFSLMTGSGSAVFGVFDSREEAQRAEGSFKGFWTAIVKTITS